MKIEKISPSQPPDPDHGGWFLVLARASIPTQNNAVLFQKEELISGSALVLLYLL
jgi:hypothetical protein